MKSLSDIMESTKKETLYVSRDMLNGDDFVKWAKSQGFKNILDPDDLHVTIAFSRTDVLWSKITPLDTNIIIADDKSKRKVSKLGDEGAVVLMFNSYALKDRWTYYREKGCSWDYDDYHSHISITYKDSDIDLSKVTPYAGKIELGPEIMKKLDLNLEG